MKYYIETKLGSLFELVNGQLVNENGDCCYYLKKHLETGKEYEFNSRSRTWMPLSNIRNKWSEE